MTIRICLLGSFCVYGPDGQDLTPRGKKACAVLALLALSPQKRRARVWLQDKLWSDRAPAQGAGSLRQALSEIRRRLKPFDYVMETSNSTVSFIEQMVELDIERPDEPGQTAGLELLEGIDIADPEFEDWLRIQRRHFQEKLQTSASPVSQGNSKCSEPILIDRSDTFGSPARAQLAADNIVSVIEQSLVENGASVVISQRSRCTQGLILEVDSKPIPGISSSSVNLRLLNGACGTTLWTNHRLSISDPDLHSSGVDLYQLANQAVDATMFHAGGTDSDAAYSLCINAVARMFRLEQSDLAAAETMLIEAYEMDPRGIFLAWQAYLQTFKFAELKILDRDALCEQATALISKAIEMEPQNSSVLALSSYVYTVLFGDVHTGAALAERSVEISATNPFGQAYFGLAKAFLGQVTEGYGHVLRARQLSGPGPYRYQIDMMCSVVAAMLGQTEDAIRYADAARTFSPRYAPPLRYLTALLLHQKDIPRARKIVSDLRILEPDFRIGHLMEGEYPVAGLRNSPVLKLAKLPRI